MPDEGDGGFTTPGNAMSKSDPRSLFDDESVLPLQPPLPDNASPGKRWRFRRNVAIYLLHRQGLSQRYIADVFDLPRSRVGEIIKEFSAYERSEVRDESSRR